MALSAVVVGGGIGGIAAAVALARVIRCPVGHHFNGPIEFLTWGGKDEHDAGRAAVSSRAGGRVSE